MVSNKILWVRRCAVVRKPTLVSFTEAEIKIWYINTLGYHNNNITSKMTIKLPLAIPKRYFYFTKMLSVERSFNKICFIQLHRYNMHLKFFWNAYFSNYLKTVQIWWWKIVKPSFVIFYIKNLLTFMHSNFKHKMS